MRAYDLDDDLKLVGIAPPHWGSDKLNSIYVLKSEKVALVDVGPSASVDDLMLGLRELNINAGDVSYIFITHIHIDHAGGVGKAIGQMPNAIVVVHKEGRPHLVEPAKLWRAGQRALGELALEYGHIEPVPEDRILVAHEGMVFHLGEMKIEVVSTPGHASHHLSFWHRNKGRLFVGDVAGVYIKEIDLVRPATPPPFNLEQTLTSLEKLIHLRPLNLYYAHFGYTTHAVEKLHYYKQKLILWGSIISHCMEKGRAEEQDIYNEIFEKDDILSRLKSLSLNHRRRELDFTKRSIRGLVDYFSKVASSVKTE